MSDEQHYTKEINIPLPERRQVASVNVGIVCTCWNQELLQPLIRNTKAALEKVGVDERQIKTPIMVPGSFELPFAAQALAQSGEVDVVLCFGLLIKGETAHFEYISQATSQGILSSTQFVLNIHCIKRKYEIKYSLCILGLMQAQLSVNVPIVYGVLNCLTREQAEARCGSTSMLPQSLAASVVAMAALKTKYYGGQVLRKSQDILEY